MKYFLLTNNWWSIFYGTERKKYKMWNGSIKHGTEVFIIKVKYDLAEHMHTQLTARHWCTNHGLTNELYVAQCL